MSVFEKILAGCAVAVVCIFGVGVAVTSRCNCFAAATCQSTCQCGGACSCCKGCSCEEVIDRKTKKLGEAK